MMIVGSSVFERTDGEDMYKLCLRLAKRFIIQEKHWNGFNILHRDIGNIGALELGIRLHDKNRSKKNPKLVYLLQSDNYNPEDIPKDAFVIYQGTHGDRGAERANLILPGATYLEKNATYVSTVGRVDTSRVAATLPFLAKDDWEIIRALSEYLNTPLPYDEVYDVRNRMVELAPYLTKYDYVEPYGFEKLLLKTYENDNISVNNTNITDNIDNYYMTNAISRASPTMAKCSHELNSKKLKNFISTFTN
jgi:NADH dehydrogenase (ubiquinone) Fe-S protein 1